jgi:hypothetical protein
MLVADENSHPGRVVWESIRRGIGGPNAPALPAPPPIHENMALNKGGADEDGVLRDLSTGEPALYLALRRAIILLRSPAISAALHDPVKDAACIARYTPNDPASINPPPPPPPALSSPLSKLTDLGSIVGGHKFWDVGAAVRHIRGHEVAPSDHAQIPWIGLGLGCPGVSEGMSWFLLTSA